MDSDKVLFLQIAAADEHAFHVLLEKYQSQIFGQAMAYLKDAFKAQDIVQEVFLDLWKARHTLSKVEKPREYLFIIARNKIANAFRRKIWLPLDPEDEQVEHWLPDRQLENKQLAALVEQAIARMPPQRKLIFEMGKKEGLKYPEIARRLQISPNTVKVHMVQALSFIRQFIRTHGLFFLIGLILFLFFCDFI